MEFDFKIKTSNVFEIMSVDLTFEDLSWNLSDAQRLINVVETLYKEEDLIEWVQDNRNAMSYIACKYIVTKSQPSNA